MTGDRTLDPRLPHSTEQESQPAVVARYDVHPAAVEAAGMVVMHLDPEGEFVRYEDYAELLAVVELWVAAAGTAEESWRKDRLREFLNHNGR
jgi:hypothetical protein